MTVAGIKDWVTLHRKEVIFALIIFLISSLSFAMGYLANREYSRAPIIVEKGTDSPSAVIPEEAGIQ